MPGRAGLLPRWLRKLKAWGAAGHPSSRRPRVSQGSPLLQVLFALPQLLLQVWQEEPAQRKLWIPPQPQLLPLQPQQVPPRPRHGPRPSECAPPPRSQRMSPSPAPTPLRSNQPDWE